MNAYEQVQSSNKNVTILDFNRLLSRTIQMKISCIVKFTVSNYMLFFVKEYEFYDKNEKSHITKKIKSSGVSKFK